MKNLTLLFIGLLFMVSFNQVQAQSATPTSIESEKSAINVLLDKIYETMSDSNFEVMESSLKQDALCLGSDPSEFWSKEEIMKIWKESYSENPPPDFSFISDREIKVAPDGKSAAVVDQFTFPITPNIPWRNIYYMEKVNDEWKISLISSALIPYNEDLEPMNAALD